MQLDCSSDLQTIAIGHMDVHQDDIRRQCPGQADSLLPIGHLGHDINIRLGFENPANSLAKDRMIISDQDSDLIHCSFTPSSALRSSRCAVGAERSEITRELAEGNPQRYSRSRSRRAVDIQLAAEEPR